MSAICIGQAIAWGVYIASFFTRGGLAGGLVIVAVFSDLEVIPGLRASRRNLLIGALACYVASGFMILMDIAEPQRVLNMIFYANFKSPFVWDFASLVLGVIVTAVHLLVAHKSKWLSLVTGIVGALVVMIEGWILSMSTGSPLWHGGMMPAMFLVEGILVALAVSLIAQADGQASEWLRHALLVFLPIPVLFNLFEIAATLYAGQTDARAATSLILANPLFWGAMILGIVVPFVLLGWASKNRSAVIVSSVLVVLGVFVAKSVTLVAGQALPFMQAQAFYTPTIVEAGGVIGVAGLAGLLYLLGKRFVPQK